MYSNEYAMDYKDDSWFLNKHFSKKKTIWLLLYYFLIHLFVLPVIAYVAISSGYGQSVANVWSQALSDFVNLFFFLYWFWPLIIESHYAMMKRLWFTIFHSVKWYIPQIITNAVLNAIIVALTGLSESSNQSAVIDLFNKNILAIAIPSLLVAPIVEELIFRGIVFRGLRKHGFGVASLVSCLSFGLLHVIISLMSQNYADLIFIFSYASMGFFFCLAYEKTKTIHGCILLHFLNNFIAIVVIGLTASIMH